MFLFDGSGVTSVDGDYNATEEIFWHIIVAATGQDDVWTPVDYSSIPQPNL